MSLRGVIFVAAALFPLSVSNGQALGPSNPRSAPTIADNDSPGTLQFGAATYSINENEGNATITVTRIKGSRGTVAVSYATGKGTATAGGDYTATSGMLYWSDGETASKTFTIPIINDTVYEGNEIVNLTLANPTGGAALGSPSTAVLTIVDDDT